MTKFPLKYALMTKLGTADLLGTYSKMALKYKYVLVIHLTNHYYYQDKTGANQDKQSKILILAQSKLGL